MDDKMREKLLRQVGAYLGVDETTLKDAIDNPVKSREDLVNRIWELGKKHNQIDYTADPVLYAASPFDGDSLTFERKQYGNSIVIEADGIIVERLCGDVL